MVQNEDIHFLIDSAPPPEVEFVLRCLDPDITYSTEDLRERLLQDWGYSAQRNLTFSTRRLFDLGLADKAITISGKPGHVLTKLGAKAREVLSIDHELYDEIMHFLHYTSYDGSPSSRKLFWSYRTCCELVWARKEMIPTPELVAAVQSQIAEEFPAAYARRIGGNFNAGGVSSGWKPWVARLQPSPFSSEEIVTITLQWEDINFETSEYIVRGSNSKVNTDMTFSLARDVRSLPYLSKA